MTSEDDRMSWYKKGLQNDADGYFMNNFHQWVIRFRKESHNLKGWLQPGFEPDKPYRDFYEPDSDYRKGEDRHSEKFWAMTPRVFDDVMKQALEQKVGWDAIDRVLAETDQPGPLNVVCKPAFLYLVSEEGFTWRDLCE